MKSNNLSLSETDSSAIRVVGPLELVMMIGGKRMSFPMAERNDGIMISGWRGLILEYKEAKLRTIGFSASDNKQSFTAAIDISNNYCQEAYKAGLRPSTENHGFMHNLTGSDVDRVSSSLSGVSYCRICNDSECFSAEIWPNPFDKSVKRFSVNIVLSSFIPEY